MLPRGKKQKDNSLRNLEQLKTVQKPAEKSSASRLSLIVVSCYVLFAGLWFTWSQVLLSQVITDPESLAGLGGTKTIVFIGVTGILLYCAVRLSTKELFEIKSRLQRSEEDLLKRLGQAAEWRDDETSDHTLRVGEYCEILAIGLGADDLESERMRKAGMLHDIGKIGIPDFVMTKTGQLTDEEYGLMQAHTLMGSDLLADSEVPMIQMAQRVAASHHEQWDGTGYPYGLKGEDIPIEGRITAVADVFDALTSRRRYKAAWSFDDAVAEIVKCAGTHFDPSVVEVFVSKQDDFKSVHDKYAVTARAVNINRAA